MQLEYSDNDDVCQYFRFPRICQPLSNSVTGTKNARQKRYICFIVVNFSCNVVYKPAFMPGIMDVVRVSYITVL